LGVRRGEKTRLQCLAWNTHAAEGLSFTFDGTALPATQREAWIQPPGFDEGFAAQVGDGPEGMEQEPNARTNEVRWLEIPGAITGCLDPVGDVDRHGFTARKGEVLVAELRSAWFGFPLDAWLRIEDGAGQELARNDDAASADPRLEWAAPADGPYFAAVGNLLQRGGPGYLYRLSLARAQPDLKATLADSAITLTPGRTNDVKLTLTRSHGFAAKLAVEAKSLPPGVRALPLDVPEKGNEVTFQLVAETNAPPFSGPFQIVLREPDSGREHPVVQELVSRGENNGVPQGYQRLVRETLDRLWLTVLTPPPAKPAPPPAAAGK
ncbi:MAG: PPC domain-containing protein, partial [Verrucomicrobiota bacterium]